MGGHLYLVCVSKIKIIYQHENIFENSTNLILKKTEIIKLDIMEYYPPLSSNVERKINQILYDNN